MYKDIIETNGKSRFENNMELVHSIPIGALVEVNIENSKYDKIRLYVVHYSRDCDGTPLYGLGYKNLKYFEDTPESTSFERNIFRYVNAKIYDGFSKECLKIIKETLWKNKSIIKMVKNIKN